MSSPMMPSSPIPVMLNNFKKKYINPLVQCSPPREDDELSQVESETEALDREPLEDASDPTAAQHWAVAMAETVCVPGCSCVFCTRRSHAGVGGDHTPITPRPRPRRYLCRSMPTTDSIMEVLYPASYLGTPGLPDLPAYFPGDSPTYPACSVNAESTQSYSSPTVTRNPVTLNYPDPLAEASPLTGIPSPETASRRVPQVPPGPPLNLPTVGLGIDILDDTEPPPEYSRFDTNRPRFPTASDVLGPYPSMPVLTPSA